MPLRHLAAAEQERFLAYDSALSEYAAVGFEYGYSVANPDALVLWEAQFGDFVNGAQSVIDEFISSGEAKWGQRSDVVLLLPHGHEGQGPDHTSGRIERFLQLCAEGSMTVALPVHARRTTSTCCAGTPSTACAARWWSSRPKSMLRNKAVVSPCADFTGGRFRSVIDDPRYRETTAPRPRSSGSCSAAARSTGSWPPPREKRNRDDTAIVRIEQLYPLPHRQLAAVLERYPNAEDFRWVQEEPANLTGPGAPGGTRRRPAPAPGSAMYATDRGIEELLERRGEETVSVEWLADRLRTFVDLNPAFEDAVERVATFLPRRRRRLARATSDADEAERPERRNAARWPPAARRAARWSIGSAIVQCAAARVGVRIGPGACRSVIHGLLPQRVEHALPPQLHPRGGSARRGARRATAA